MKTIITCVRLLACVALFTGAAQADSLFRFQEPDRAVLRSADAIGLSPILPDGPKIFYLPDVKGEADAKNPLRSFEARLKYIVGLLGTRAATISGGELLARDRLAKAHFGEAQEQRSRAAVVSFEGGQRVTNLVLVTNITINPLPPITDLPHYRLVATIIDATEEPVVVFSGRSWVSAVFGPLMSGTTVDGGLRWRKSISRVRVIVGIEDFRTHISLADGEVEATLHKRERGAEFGVRYGARAAATLTVDRAITESVEEALTACTAQAFVIAWSRLAGVPLSMSIGNTWPDEVTRDYVVNAWQQASPERRTRSLRFAQALAAERGLTFPAWPDPSVAASADRWCQVLEALPSPAGPFDQAPTTKAGRREIRIVLEGFPYRRFDALRPLLPSLILRADPDGSVTPDPMAPECGFRFRASRGSPDLEAMRAFLHQELSSLTGNAVDFQIDAITRTLWVKYRSSISPTLLAR